MTVAGFDWVGTNGAPRRRKIEPMATEQDWYLQEWMTHFGKIQASLQNELGWTKNRAHVVWHSTQPYRRDIVNEIAGWLNIRPYELLMRPREAFALRQLRETAQSIVSQVAENDTPQYDPGPSKRSRTGT